ncbi:unnamed protein product [Linum trigynum]|uniref:Uncharacterized protein n=1 Tax=Linum trigynum TaxID=586398 RepID=A0AAV2FED6_9ROSI
MDNPQGSRFSVLDEDNNNTNEEIDMEGNKSVQMDVSVAQAANPPTDNTTVDTAERAEEIQKETDLPATMTARSESTPMGVDLGPNRSPEGGPSVMKPTHPTIEDQGRLVQTRKMDTGQKSTKSTTQTNKNKHIRSNPKNTGAKHGAGSPSPSVHR